MTLTNNRITADNFKLKLNGSVALDKEIIALSTSLETNRVKEVVDSLPKHWSWDMSTRQER